MCNCTSGNLEIPGSPSAPRNDGGKSLPVNRVRIEQLVRIDERQPCPALAFVDLAIKARPPAGVAGGAGLLDPDPDRVLIAVQPHLDHALDMARGRALAPQRVARAAEVPRLPACDGFS